MEMFVLLNEKCANYASQYMECPQHVMREQLHCFTYIATLLYVSGISEHFGPRSRLLISCQLSSWTLGNFLIVFRNHFVFRDHTTNLLTKKMNK